MAAAAEGEKKMITLKSSDGEEFEVEAVGMESQTIRHMIEDKCADNGIPLPNVNSKILSKVIEYCNKHVHASADDSTSSADLKNWTPTSSRSTRPPSSTSSCAEFVQIYLGCTLLPTLGCKLSQHQGMGLLDLSCADRCRHDQGQDSGGNPQDLQHQEGLGP
ncbi:Os02g0101600 [Oryza sativa Japonica Group]|uniref:Os02g0101600 protein n=1 Tax=Oryza sativa subsp. japonica TaxID=39947 RepID=A0A0P0VDK6_ORYSJ|nr:hypothetical protein EE612_008265 [Oryza sativa]BAS76515.1 Os02g0101600 [Oryza sativa Japonica Group]